MVGDKYLSTCYNLWITHKGGGITIYVMDHPSGMGYTPHMGPPPPRIPPYIVSECQFRGDNPQYNAKKFLGKKSPFSEYLY